MFNTSGGCIGRTPLDCQSEGGFVKVTEVKLPDLIDFHVTVDMSLRKCRVLCLNNCSCKAYAYSNLNGSSTGWLMWSGDLIDIRALTSEAIQRTSISASTLLSGKTLVFCSCFLIVSYWGCLQ